MREEGKKQLEEAGLDVGEALERFMGSEMLFKRFLKKFLEDENYGKLKKAVEAEEWEAAFQASHTLKGVCGNLSMKPLFEKLNDQVRMLRENKHRQASDMMPEIDERYQKMYDAVRNLNF